VVGILLFLRFVLELALITAVGAGAWDLAGGGGLGALAATVAAAAVVIVWGMAIAPKARRRWPDPNRLVLECALFVIGGIALAATGDVVTGVAFTVASAAVAVAVRQLSAGTAP
jgi:hypothetical protein